MRRVLPLLLVVVAAGCGQPNPSNPFDRASRAAGQLRVQVHNRNFNDATLHLLSGGSRVRLGTVTGKSNQSFRVRWEAHQEARVQVDLVGGRRFTSNGVSVQPGESVELFIESQVERSRLIHGTR